MAGSQRRVPLLALAAVLAGAGVVLMATELAAGIGATLIVWGCAALSYRYTAGEMQPEPHGRSGPSAR